MNKANLLIILLFLTSVTNAYNLRQLSNKEGLSNSAILSICQDNERFTWIGTADGLNMYNGAEIHIFKPEIKTAHLHLGMQLIFDESQKEGASEIWVDYYNVVRFLSQNRCETVKNQETKEYSRVYQMKDPAVDEFLTKNSSTTGPTFYDTRVKRSCVSCLHENT